MSSTSSAWPRSQHSPKVAYHRANINAAWVLRWHRESDHPTAFSAVSRWHSECPAVDMANLHAKYRHQQHHHQPQTMPQIVVHFLTLDFWVTFTLTQCRMYKSVLLCLFLFEMWCVRVIEFGLVGVCIYIDTRWVWLWVINGMKARKWRLEKTEALRL